MRRNEMYDDEELEPEDRGYGFFNAERIVFWIMILVGLAGLILILITIFYTLNASSESGISSMFGLFSVIYITIVVFYIEMQIALVYGIFGIRNRLDDLHRTINKKSQPKKKRRY